jgi:hypothetical protein
LRCRGSLGVVIGLSTACTTGSFGTIGDITVTVTRAFVDPAAMLVVAGYVCGAAPPVQLELVETRETYPVRLVMDVRASGPPSAACHAFETSIGLDKREPFAESCRERCLIEIRTPDARKRTIEYRTPGG